MQEKIWKILEKVVTLQVLFSRYAGTQVRRYAGTQVRRYASKSKTVKSMFKYHATKI